MRGLCSVVVLSGGWGCLGFGLFLFWDPGALLFRAAAACERFFTSSASSSVQLPQHIVFCGALNYFFALVKLGFVPISGVSVIVNGFVGAKGSVGTTMSGPPWKSPPGAATSMVLGSCTR